jgi:hypothetical protein
VIAAKIAMKRQPSSRIGTKKFASMKGSLLPRSQLTLGRLKTWPG